MAARKSKSKANNPLLIGGLVVALLVVAGYMVSASSKKGALQTKTTKIAEKRDQDDDKMGKKDQKDPNEFTIKARNYAFEPQTITVKKGAEVEIELESVEGEHSFVIDALNVRSDIVKEGEEDDVEFVATDAGTYEFYCGVDGHRAMGMVGTIVVEE